MELFIRIKIKLFIIIIEVLLLLMKSKKNRIVKIIKVFRIEVNLIKILYNLRIFTQIKILNNLLQKVMKN